MIDLDALEALEEQCPKCKGKGGNENTGWYQSLAIHNFRLQILETKDKSSIIKDKTADQPDKPVFFFCRNCNGRGKILTPKGRLLMEFVRSWMNPNY